MINLKDVKLNGIGSSNTTRSIDHFMYPKPKDLNATIFYNGQLNVWDDDPEESFGQVWMPVCIWCKRGPLSSWDGLTCNECVPKILEYIKDKPI